MSMCSTNIQDVCSALLNKPGPRRLFEERVREIAEAQSFHYEALFLEIVFRVQRQLRKSEDASTKQFAATIVNAFPASISSVFAQITPKVRCDLCFPAEVVRV